jgi:hypothetical protein
MHGPTRWRSVGFNGIAVVRTKLDPFSGPRHDPLRPK